MQFDLAKLMKQALDDNKKELDEISNKDENPSSLEAAEEEFDHDFDHAETYGYSEQDIRDHFEDHKGDLFGYHLSEFLKNKISEKEIVNDGLSPRYYEAKYNDSYLDSIKNKEDPNRFIKIINTLIEDFAYKVRADRYGMERGQKDFGFYFEKIFEKIISSGGKEKISDSIDYLGELNLKLISLNIPSFDPIRTLVVNQFLTSLHALHGKTSDPFLDLFEEDSGEASMLKEKYSI